MRRLFLILIVVFLGMPVVLLGQSDTTMLRIEQNSIEPKGQASHRTKKPGGQMSQQTSKSISGRTGTVSNRDLMDGDSIFYNGSQKTYELNKSNKQNSPFSWFLYYFLNLLLFLLLLGALLFIWYAIQLGNKFKNIVPANINNALSEALVRDLSHNVGSHVLPYYNKLLDASFAGDKTNDVTHFKAVTNYIKNRSESISQIKNTAILASANLINPLQIKENVINTKENKIVFQGLVDGANTRPISFNGLGENNVTIALPPHGASALMMILENILRNDFKHGEKNGKYGYEMQLNKYNQDKTQVFFEVINSNKKKYSDASLLVEKINKILGDDILDTKTNKLRSQHLGLAGMKIASAYIQSIPIEKVEFMARSMAGNIASDVIAQNPKKSAFNLGCILCISDATKFGSWYINRGAWDGYEKKFIRRYQFIQAGVFIKEGESYRLITEEDDKTQQVYFGYYTPMNIGYDVLITEEFANKYNLPKHNEKMYCSEKDIHKYSANYYATLNAKPGLVRQINKLDATIINKIQNAISPDEIVNLVKEQYAITNKILNTNIKDQDDHFVNLEKIKNSKLGLSIDQDHVTTIEDLSNHSDLGIKSITIREYFGYNSKLNLLGRVDKFLIEEAMSKKIAIIDERLQDLFTENIPNAKEPKQKLMYMGGLFVANKEIGIDLKTISESDYQFSNLAKEFGEHYDFIIIHKTLYDKIDPSTRSKLNKNKYILCSGTSQKYEKGTNYISFGNLYAALQQEVGIKTTIMELIRKSSYQYE
jgi:hypothetical protein